MNKQAIWLIIIFGGLLAWLTVEYFDHLRTFEQQNLVKVQVSNVSCGGTRGSNITVTINNQEGSLEVTRRVCNSLSIGEQINVLQSTSTDNYYQNEEPSKRFFWLYPVPSLFFAYILHSNRKKGKLHNKVKERIWTSPCEVLNAQVQLARTFWVSISHPLSSLNLWTTNRNAVS